MVYIFLISILFLNSPAQIKSRHFTFFLLFQGAYKLFCELLAWNNAIRLRSGRPRNLRFINKIMLSLSQYITFYTHEQFLTVFWTDTDYLNRIVSGGTLWTKTLYRTFTHPHFGYQKNKRPTNECIWRDWKIVPSLHQTLRLEKVVHMPVR